MIFWAKRVTSLSTLCASLVSQGPWYFRVEFSWDPGVLIFSKLRARESWQNWAWVWSERNLWQEAEYEKFRTKTTSILEKNEATPPAPTLDNKADPRIQLLDFIASDPILESFITYGGWNKIIHSLNNNIFTPFLRKTKPTRNLSFVSLSRAISVQ